MKWLLIILTIIVLFLIMLGTNYRSYDNGFKNGLKIGEDRTEVHMLEEYKLRSIMPSKPRVGAIVWRDMSVPGGYTWVQARMGYLRGEAIDNPRPPKEE